MTDNLRQALANLRTASENSSKFVAQELEPGKNLEYKDFFEMAVAFCEEEIAEIEYKIAIAEEFSLQIPAAEMHNLERKLETEKMDLACYKERRFRSQRP